MWLAVISLGCCRPAACTSSLQRVQGVLVEAPDALGLVGHHQRLLAQRVLRGDAGRAAAPVWQVWAWMQPSANMKPRAALHQSAPSAIMRAMSKALITLPARRS
jgi:hypothetical protein